MILRQKMRRRTRFVVVIFGVILTSFVLRMGNAGSLTPSAAPASTMHSAEDIYAALASTSFDSSAIVADGDGSVLQITKCIIAKQHGGNC